MNGHDHPELFSPPEFYRPDDDERWQMVNIECPFCRHNIVWTGSRLACFICEVLWNDDAEVERDRKQEQGK